MSQHDYNIANQGFPNFRTDLNNALGAIATNNSGATAPTTTFAHQWWLDTSTTPNTLRIRNADNDAWVVIGTVNQTDDTFVFTPAAGSASAPAYSVTGDTNTGIFFPAADTIAFTEGGAEAMRIDSSGNVGIGTTSAGSKLDVKGTLRLSGSSSGYVGLAPAAAAGSTTYTLPSADGTSGQVLSTNGSGTLSWAATTASSISAGDSSVAVTDTGSNGTIAFTTDGTERGRFSSAGQFTTVDGTVSAPSHSFTSDTNNGMYRVGTDHIGFSAGGTRFITSQFTRGTIASSTNGTDNPQIPFISIGGGADIQSTDTTAACINIATNGAYRLDAAPYQIKINAPARGNNTGYAAPEENGVVGIITDGSYGGNAVTGANALFIKNNAAILDVAGGSAGIKIISSSYAQTYGVDSLLKVSDPNGGGTPVGVRAIVDTSAGVNDNSGPVCFIAQSATTDNYTKTNGGAPLIMCDDRRSGSTSRTAITFRRNTRATEVGSITTTNTATTYSTSSDYRLKENVAPMTGALEKVSKLKPVTFNWKVNGSLGEGFIAHELQSVIPQAVTGDKDDVEQIKDGEGNVIDTKPKYQSIDTSFVVATLTAAIQELNAKVETLEAQNAAFEARLAALENK